MHVLVTGAAGMIGRKLVDRLARDRSLNGQAIDKLTLLDIVPAQMPLSVQAIIKTADLSSPGAAEEVIATRPDVIFHLAGIVSGEAETDFDKGYRVNLDGTRNLLEAIRMIGDGYKPKVIYTSSIAVFGAPFPESIPDDFHLTPLTSYGAQKVIGETLLADYTRRGFLSGVGIRLPGITVRPGKPNKAASGFYSGIIREPLAGREAMLPVADDTTNTHASPRAAAGFLVHGASLRPEQLGPRINLTMPGVCCTVGEQIAALRRVAGDRVAARIRREPDEFIMRIVAGWPSRFDATRARELGFTAENSFDEIIRVHIEDDLAGDFVR
ncbi:D-erythronate dehydrogenase [Pseudorhodoplanes sinuspersici]|uniref:NAD-dependent epimerase n=1 Tax=Pseudorhodoplanes sinuspersici TaxID=1235591 RepID=A0A1W6ZNX7_9HYPH|nr:D-erythronate dehydrogenase [Pseudorhodoplanes sinuspersici]ARP99071.1 NAD-dependent epimerase [Pseudorhodoplanes sinuspersici]